MKEFEIRNRAAHDCYMELARLDAEALFGDPSTFIDVPCPPVCGEPAAGSQHTCLLLGGEPLV